MNGANPRRSDSPPPPPVALPDLELLGRIDAGNYGEVWLARTVTGALRAVKIVRRDRFETAEPFDREYAGITAYEPLSRTHDGLMDILHVGRNDAEGWFHYVMELADDGSESRVNSLQKETVGETQANEDLAAPDRQKAGLRTYTARTLESELKSRGRLPVARCVEVGLALADALHYLHQHELVHRDVKPANVIFVGGMAKLADPGSIKSKHKPGTLIGTEGFIPPEGPGRPQGDVFSLGRLLYEASTGLAAHKFPNAPSDVAAWPDHLAWLDLNEVICRACQSNAAARYASAAEMRADLLLLQGGGSLKRLRLVERQLKMALYCGIAGAVLAGTWLWIQQSRTAAAQARAKIAEERAQGQRRQVLIQQLQMTRLTAHEAGWSETIWQQVAEAAKIRKDVDLQSQAAASLGGLDARQIKHFTNFSTSSLAFDTQGKRLLMGGMAEGGRLWDSLSNQIKVSEQNGAGPVIFRADGTALQFAVTTNSSIVLWNIGNQKPIREFTLPFLERPNATADVLSAIAVTPDGSVLAASTTLSDQRKEVWVWETGSSEIDHRFPVNANALALSPDGKFLAAGNEEGNVSVWSLSDANQLYGFSSGHVTIQSLKFVRDTRSNAADAAKGASWLLAAGDSGGTVALWDIRTQSLREKYRGSNFDVFALAFSPDGTLLASGGRNEIRLWDVANARLLLTLGSTDHVTALAFSPDGKMLASNTARENSARRIEGNVILWELQRGRGIDNLLGLSAQIARVTFSADVKCIAAQAHNWEVGVWEVSTRNLKRIFRVPQGALQADNAAIALSHDGQQLAFAAGVVAKLWDVGSGNVIGNWRIPDGYADQFIFSSTNRLLLFRAEKQSGTVDPLTRDRDNDPLVCRIRDLSGSNPTQPIAEINEFNWRLFGTRASPIGTFFVAEGLHRQNGNLMRMVKAFDSLSGITLWTRHSTNSIQSTLLAIDPLGQILTVRISNQEMAWVEALSGIGTEELSRAPSAIAPKRSYWTVSGQPGMSDRGLSLIGIQRRAPLVTFQIDSLALACLPEFSMDGNLLAWGNQDGTVSLCDLRESRRQLSQLNVGWSEF